MKIILTALTLSAFSFCASSAAVMFIGTDGTLDFDASSGSFSKDGIEVTLIANDGTVNATTAGLGVNDSGSSDDTNGLDTINLTETLTFSFDQDVMFNSLSIVEVGTNDALEASFNGGAAISLASSGTQTFNTLLLSGQTLVLTAIAPNAPTANNGISITEFTVTAVPEPSSSTLIGLGCLAIMMRKRR